MQKKFKFKNIFSFHFLIESSKENGSIAFFALLIICLLIFLFSQFQLFNILNTEKSTRYICQSELLKTQEKTGIDLQKLLELNPSVKQIHQLQKIADAMIKVGVATLDPPLIEAGEQIQTLAETFTKTVTLLQNFYLDSATFKMNFGQTRASQLVIEDLRQRQALQNQWKTNSLFSTELKVNQPWQKPSLPAVKIVDRGQKPPEYEPEDDFMHKQALHVSWNYEHEIGRGKYRLWKQILVKKKLACAASLEVKNDHFYGVLIKAKY